MIILHCAPITNRLTGIRAAVTQMVNAQNNHPMHSVALLNSAKSPFNDEIDPITLSIGLFGKISDLQAPFNNPDLIIFHSTYIPKQMVLAIKAHRRNIPYILVPHGGLEPQAQDKSRLKKTVTNTLFFNRIVKKASAIQCLTEAEKTHCRVWNPQCFVSGNGVEIPLKAPQRATSGPLNLLFLGRLAIHHKGLDMLLESISHVRSILEEHAVSFTFCGPDFDNGRAVIDSMINKYSIGHLVQVNPPVMGRAKEKILAKADVFVHTSRHEGQPMAILEALAAGLPCLVTPETNMAEPILRANAGWSVSGSVGAIANALSAIVTDQRWRQTYGEAAFELARDSYDIQIVANQALDQYTRAVKDDL